MSGAFRPPSSGGGSGLTPEQLASLVTDPELAAGLAGLATAAALADVGAAVEERATQAQVQAVSDALTVVAYDVDTIGQLAGAAQMPGEVKLVLPADGATPAGHERISGLAPFRNQWSPSRIVQVPSRNDGVNPLYVGAVSYSVFAGSSGYGAAYSAAHGEAILFHAGSSGAARQVRALNFETMAWRALAAFPYAVGLGGFVTLQNGDAFAVAGGQANTSGVANYRYSRDTDSWSALANRPVAQWQAITLPRSDGGVAVFGGTSTYSASYSNALRTVQTWDPGTGAWTVQADLDTTTRVYAPVAVAPISGTSKFLARCVVSDGSTGGTQIVLLDADALTVEVVEAIPAGYGATQSQISTIFPGPTGTAIARSQVQPMGASGGLQYDPSQPYGSRWTPFDLGESCNYAAADTCGLWGMPVGVAFAHNGYSLAWQWNAQSSSTAYPLPVLVNVQAPDISPTAAFYVRKT